MRLDKLLFFLIGIISNTYVWGDNVILPPVVSVANNQTVIDTHLVPGIRESLHFAEKYVLNSPLLPNATTTFSSDGAYSMSALITGANVNKLDSLVAISSNKKITYRPQDIINGSIDTDIFDGSTLSITYYGRDAVNVEYVCTGIIPMPDQHIARNKDSQYAKSWKCMVDAVCDSRTNVIRRSVCRLIVGGTELGTGTLINNADEDMRPLVLTAAHVFKGNPNATIKAKFGFEVTDCQYPSEPAEETTETIRGLELLCFYPQYDIALFELNSIPSDIVNPYWSGWDISGVISDTKEYICIHQPYGDVRKVSIGTDLKLDDYSATGAKTPEGYTFASNVHYNVQTWLSGTTQGGSSGSGLWDNNKLIATLSGGYGTCSALGNDYYVSLALAWNKRTGEYSSLQEVLDPNNTSLSTLTGRDLYSKESASKNINSEEGTVHVVRDCGKTTVVAKNISEISIHGLDGRLLQYQQFDSNKTNEVEINTISWSNKLILVRVKFGHNNEETVKVITK